MASITARRNKKGEITSYTIRAYHGYSGQGKRLKPYSMSWKPEKGMTARQIEKKLAIVAAEFEERCINGIAGNAEKITMEEFCAVYLESKSKTLSPSTYEFYKRTIEKIIKPAFGHHKISHTI